MIPDPSVMIQSPLGSGISH